MQQPFLVGEGGGFDQIDVMVYLNVIVLVFSLFVIKLQLNIQTASLNILRSLVDMSSSPK